MTEFCNLYQIAFLLLAAYSFALSWAGALGFNMNIEYLSSVPGQHSPSSILLSWWLAMPCHIIVISQWQLCRPSRLTCPDWMSVKRIVAAWPWEKSTLSYWKTLSVRLQHTICPIGAHSLSDWSTQFGISRSYTALCITILLFWRHPMSCRRYWPTSTVCLSRLTCPDRMAVRENWCSLTLRHVEFGRLDGE